MSLSSHPLKVCKCARWKQSSAVKSNTVGSLVSWHDRLWLAQLSRKEGHSFGKWRAPGSKMAWKSGCFSYSQETRLKLRTVPGCSRSSATDPHKQPIVTRPHDITSPWVLIRHAACMYTYELTNNAILMPRILTEMGVWGKYSSVLYISFCLLINGLEAKTAAWDINHRGLKRRVWCHISQALSIS